MTAPTVVNRTSGTVGSSAAIQSIPLGSPVAGELILAVVFMPASQGSPPSTPIMWIDTDLSGNEWATSVQNTSVHTLGVYWKVANGSDVLTLFVNPSAGFGARYVVFRISGHGSAVTVSTLSSGSFTANADPPNVAQSGAAQDTLFIAVMGSATVVATAAPSGYSNLTTVSGGPSTAEKTANATSDNPGTFTSATAFWLAATIAVASTAITTNARETQETVETLSQVNPNLRVTQEVVETLTQVAPNARVTQLVVEVLSSSTLVTASTQPVVQSCG